MNKFENNYWIPAFSSLDMLPEAGFPVVFFFPSGNTIFLVSTPFYIPTISAESYNLSLSLSTHHFKDFRSISLHFVWLKNLKSMNRDFPFISPIIHSVTHILIVSLTIYVVFEEISRLLPISWLGCLIFIIFITFLLISILQGHDGDSRRPWGNIELLFC